MGTVIDQFRAAMSERGIDTRDDIIPDGKLRRFRVEGDKAGSENGWYILFADEHPNGTFGCWKRYAGEKLTWSSKETAPDWTPEQRKEWQEKMERRRLEREADDQARQAAAAEKAEQLLAEADDADDNHPYCKRKKVKAHSGIKVGRWEVTNSKGETTLVSKLALLIPIRDTRKKVWSVQAIFPHNRNVLDRDKDYLKDGAKHGFFFTIGKLTDEKVILLCEGYATGASLHEATGYPVVVAFDTSNLEAVAAALRERFPDFRIVLCGDNDRWTVKPIENPGKHYAEGAAAKIGALVVLPEFQNLETKPTDFNDLAQLEGLEMVRRMIEEVLARPMASETAPAEPLSSPPSPAEPLEGEVLPKESSNKPPPPDDGDNENVTALPFGNNHFFEVLGYDHETYYIFHRRKSQLLIYDRTQFSENAFAELAPVGAFWQRHFKGGKKGSFDKIAAFEFLVHCAHERGIFDPDRARGRGAWFDNGRVVYHHGGYLSVDGVTCEISALKTNHIYEMQRSLPDLQAVEPLTAAEGDELVFLARDFRWKRPVSAALLIGWMLFAPICGALRWRPHVWITGGAGSGKSTILNEFVNPLLYSHNLFAQGNTTEAGLRQKLRTDALPIIFEESEQNEEKDRLRIQHVLSLIRQSSTESIARVYKGTVAGQSMEFLIRSMFCLASIQVGMKQQADLERVTILALKSKSDKSEDDGSTWEALEKKLYEKIESRPTIGARFVKRAMMMIPIIRENIHVFSSAANKFFGTHREGDQYGSLLAGYWSMYRDDAATQADALSVLDSFTWEEHRDVSDSDEGQAALSALMGSRLRTAKNQEFTIFEVLSAGCGTPVQGVEMDRIEANALLRRYGMLAKDGRLLLANLSVELQRIMDRTTFAADWRGVLLRLPGADRNDNKTASFNGVASKCVRIPIPEPDTGVQKSWLTAENPVERG